jgi:hypothetical protein
MSMSLPSTISQPRTNDVIGDDRQLLSGARISGLNIATIFLSSLYEVCKSNFYDDIMILSLHHSR